MRYQDISELAVLMAEYLDLFSQKYMSEAIIVGAAICRQ